MNYAKIYSDFIADRRAKEADLLASGEYSENHHILPRSLGGGDEAENLIHGSLLLSKNSRWQAVGRRSFHVGYGI